MSATGSEVLDQTWQKTIWLKESPDRRRAYHAMRALLDSLRDASRSTRRRI